MNLENLGVQEMDAQEVKNINGGSKLMDLFLSIGGVIADVIFD